MEKAELINVTNWQEAAVNEENELIDILDRQEIVNRIMDIINTLSDAKSSCTFALDGSWGSGKSFVFNMLEKQLREYQDGQHFMVFHYNCWKYDYYDEPLVALISSMIDEIDEYLHIFSREAGELIKSNFIETTQIVLQRIAATFAANKIGIDVGKISEVLSDIKDSSKNLEDVNAYDSYKSFNKVLNETRKELEKITEEQTLVIVVDELDRCMPDYAIKILERLHHLFTGLNNTVVIIGVDRKQLDNTIKQIFGESIDCNAYLKKFIDFEIKLDVGSINERFAEKFAKYMDCFYEDAILSWDELNVYISALFSEMDIRKQEHIIKKIQMIHNLLFSEQGKRDYSFLCFELLMAVMEENKVETKTPPLYFVSERAINADGEYNKCRLRVNDNLPQKFVNYVNQQWKYPVLLQYGNIKNNAPYFANQSINIPKLLISYSCSVYSGNDDLFALSKLYYQRYDEYVKELKEVKHMLEIIE